MLFHRPRPIHSTSGCDFRPHPTALVLPPSSFHVARLSGVTAATGTLAVRGCTVRLANASPQEFVLPLLTPDDDQRRKRHESLALFESDRLKTTGLALYRGSRAVKEGGPTGETRFLQCRVVPELPLLRVKATSLPHGAIMLYDGERCARPLLGCCMWS
jgi:hypothetical protein